MTRLTDDELARLARLVAEVRRLRAALINREQHLFLGLCPDGLQPDSRDPNCPVCAALDGGS